MKPITDIAIVPRQPRWPVRLDPVAPPSLRKAPHPEPEPEKKVNTDDTAMATLMFGKQTDPSAINPCQRAGLLSALAIAALCSACAPSDNISEIPHPPFTAERLSRFEDGAINTCRVQLLYKATGVKRLAQEETARELASTSHIANVSGIIEVENQEFEKLFREENDCYIAAQIKWGVTQPLSSDQFERMGDAISERCDKPYKETYQVWQQAHPPRKSLTDLQAAAEEVKEMMKALGDMAAARDQCYRDIQTEWSFK